MSKTWQRQTGSAKRHGCHRNQAGYSPCSADETLLGFSDKDSEYLIEKHTENSLNALTTNLPVGDCTEVKVESSTPENSKGHHKNEWQNGPWLLKPEL